jgi:ADP-heptose:LPS heptosyltransferase
MRALVLHGGAIGDFVLTLGVIQGMRAAANVTLIGRTTVAELAAPRNGIDAFYDLDAGGFHALFQPGAVPNDRARRAIAGHELAVSFLGDLPVVEAQLRALGVARVVSIDPRPRPEHALHITEQWRADLTKAGVSISHCEPHVTVPASELGAARTEFARLFESRDAGVIILHPGSGSPDKCWPVAKWTALVRPLRERGLACATLVGPAERERFSPGELAPLLASAPALETASLAGVAAWLAASRAFVGNDSGISHLAAAVGASVIAIFGPTDPATWRPLSKKTTIVHQAGGWPCENDVLQSLLSLPAFQAQI